MGAPTETYVDPSIAGNSGSGTIGDPYGDLQYALNQITRNATDGDRINIKAGTDEVLAASLDFTSYGAPTPAAPLVFQGYTSAAGDGGIGGVSGDDSYTIISGGTIDNVCLIDLHLHHSGSTNFLLDLDNYIVVVRCELDNGKSVNVDTHCLVISCYFHDLSNVALLMNSGALVAFNTFDYQGSNYTVSAANGSATYLHNVFQLANGVGMRLISYGTQAAIGNSLFSVNGTGSGILAFGSYGGFIIVGNIVEGFSGVGGTGIEIEAGGVVALYGHNAFYNNSTNLDKSGDVMIDLSANDQALDASPFTDAANGDFTVTDAVKALGYPTANFPDLAVRSYLDIGALQRMEAGGGGGSIFGTILTG